MADKFLSNNAGRITEKEATVTSAGAGDAGEIVALDAAGKLDSTVMPVGVGADTQVIVASEALTAGDFVNVYNDTGTPKCRKADASDGTKPANGFVLDNVDQDANATVYFDSENTALTGMTIGARQYLSETAGDITETAPTTSGALVQYLGTARSATELGFDPQEICINA